MVINWRKDNSKTYKNGINDSKKYTSANLITFDKTCSMVSSTKSISLADYYFGFLKNLNPDSKLQLISKLLQSLKESETVPETSLESLFGAYKSDETAEEIIEAIRSSRVSKTDVETI